MKLTLEELTRAVHTTFRRWHRGETEARPWNEMLVVTRRLADRTPAALPLAVKEVLLNALAELEQQAVGSAQLLRLRFLDGLPATAAANRMNLTENVVYKQQAAAIEALAAAILRSESEARAEKAARVLERLETKEPPRLFGIHDKLDQVLSTLSAHGPPWLAAVLGIGGIGKTSLVDAVVRRLVETSQFVNIAWVSARQDRFTFWNGLEEKVLRDAALSMEELVDTLVEQLGFLDLGQLPATQKRAGLRARLNASPYLVIVDNLETAVDYQALVPELQNLANPTWFLLTSRHSLHDYPGVRCLSLDELSENDSLELLRHEMSTRCLEGIAGVTEEDLRQVYRVAGGNPLALKLLVGQMYTLSLSKVIDNLRQARGRSVEDLYRYIYWQSWSLLTDQARKVLAIMPLVAQSGGQLEHIATLSEVENGPLLDVLQQLIALCLVNVRGSVDDRRYSVHRLTETFLLNEVLKWPTMP
ncbi:MAG: hypothetical protein EHM56_01205 [Chloroflexi bacterium]|nr:MAG: hypothetical protein EHM56_01205 [Chloroflexota bacterium]